jgi:hypothetical protein
MGIVGLPPVPHPLPTWFPNFFIVGAAKAGTTSLQTCLSLHSQCFMSDPKEPNFLAPDVDMPGDRISSWPEYLSLFRSGADRPVRGEASVSYLTSETAPSAIAQLAPEPRVLISLRNPVDILVAQFSEGRAWGIEPCADVNDALAGLVAPSVTHRPFPAPDYGQHAHHAENVERYVKTFPPHQLRVVVFEEWTRQPDVFVPSILRYLGLDHTEIPPLPRARPSVRRRSRRLQRMLVTPPAGTRRVFASRPGQSVRAALMRANVDPRPPAPLDSGLREALTDWLRPDVERLSTLLGRDLTQIWFATGNQRPRSSA